MTRKKYSSQMVIRELIKRCTKEFLNISYQNLSFEMIVDLKFCRKQLLILKYKYKNRNEQNSNKLFKNVLKFI